MRRPLALSGTALVEPLGGEHHDEQSGPVGNGVAEERAPVGVLVPAGVKHDPQREHRARRRREGMSAPEGFLWSHIQELTSEVGCRWSVVVRRVNGNSYRR